MSDDPRLEPLLDELLDSHATPEQVCASFPELLPEVRRRWQEIKRVRDELDVLFPPSIWPEGRTPSSSLDDTVLPRISGYEVIEVLGRGGVGVVYKALHQRLNRHVALKMLLSGQHASPDELERFLREAEAVAGLRHPNVVHLYDVGEVEGKPYFTMEFIDGGSLARKLAEGPMPAREAAALVAQIAEAMERGHRSGIIHRDLKPGNVLLTADGTPKVTDFGLARLESGAGLTLSGAPVGTPSYMAPEQARGEKSQIGPATDVYALGAILYECLTGRPPFRAETATATLQQVLDEEPVRPAQLNPRIQRDAETICLKCLEKDPRRRYVSAVALADDLHRFERGDPITARPLGRLERTVRWTRRHPAQALVLAATVVVATAAAGVGGWLIGQRNRVVHQVEVDLVRVLQFQQQSALPEAGQSLQQAQLRLGDHGPRWIRSLLVKTQKNQELLERLEAIRMTRSTFVEGRDNHLAEVRFNNARADREYQAAFREAELGQPVDDPDAVAARVKASAVRAPLVAALDDWAVCCPERTSRQWTLRVARGADPDAWRHRARDPEAWEDVAALVELAQTAPLAKQPPSLLLALGERLQLAGGDGVGVLRRVQQQHSHDFWTNFALARALYSAGRQGKCDLTAAIPYYQKALELRPKAVAVDNNLGLVQVDIGWLDDNALGRSGPGAITIFRRALQTDSDFAPARNNLGLCIKRKGPWWLAVHEYRDALRADPELAPAHFNLAEIEAGSNRINEGIEHYREALRIDPDFALAHYYLGIALLAKGRQDEVFEYYPADVESLNELRGAALGEANAYYWQPHDLHPNWVAARNGLRIPPQDGARLDEAIGHFREAIRLEPGRFRHHGTLGQALLAKRKFVEADVAICHCLELLPPQESKLRENVKRLRERCLRLQALEGRLPDIVQGTDKPATDECLDAAELCFVKNYYATAARIYGEALVATPQLTADLRAGHRFNAACAAALAGTGQGDDAARLTESERKGLREHAREWLQLDLADWAKKVDTGTPADRIQARKALSQWPEEPDLAELRESDALDRLSADERKECDALWSEVADLLNRARVAM
jgi:serine/threonine-protein kinase